MPSSLKNVSLLIALACSLLAPAAVAQTESVIYSFKGGTAGAYPYSGVTMDSHGNLYGTTKNGGKYWVFGGQPGGTVYKLLPTGPVWSETILYNFGGPLDGNSPYSGVILDSSGNLYGTAANGGQGLNYGTFYRITPGDLFPETGLFTFNGLQQNATPYDLGTVITDSQGNFYGTNSGNALYGTGNVFQMTLTSNGFAEETVLHEFQGGPADGANPYAGLVMDAEGDLFGTTTGGGPGCTAAGCGTVFELSPNGDGTYREGIIYAFAGGPGDGAVPYGGLVQDLQGHLYGTTAYGGTYGSGTVFELAYQGNGTWAESVLYSFGNHGDGAQPWGRLLIDSHGNLYGHSRRRNLWRRCWYSLQAFAHRHRHHLDGDNITPIWCRQRRSISTWRLDYGCKWRFIRHRLVWRVLRRGWGI